MRKVLFFILITILFISQTFFTKPVYASVLAEQTTSYPAQLTVWQLIQELGNNLSGPAGSFTFRVFNSKANLQMFNFTATNSKIYDKDAGSTFIRGCGGADNTNQLTGLTFNTAGVPAGFEDVTIDFTCNHYNFIPGHRYLILITNANITSQIQFAAVAYGASSNDYFSGGGLRYGNGNIFDFFHGSGSCHPDTYIWGDTTLNPVSGCYVWTSPRDDLYFVLDDGILPTPTPTPSVSPGPTPFLDLPWDYEGKGLSFNEAANSMTSYFDHSYPLLSSGLSEPNNYLNQITTFDNENSTTKNYSSHDGYDYAKIAKVNIGDPVLAAAAGTATYINTCSACGNMIVIDHGNGYQTRYLHLQKDGLITNVPGQKVTVIDRQQIGKVGATGNVSPKGDAGAHIHFGVFQDKNSDGSFDDNVPDGVTDPFGWQSKDPDPWPAYVFNYAGRSRTGNTSFYLWKKKLDNLDSTLTSNGGVFNLDRYNMNFPQGSTNQNLKISIQSSPITKPSNTLQSIGSTIVATATDTLGNLISQFQSLFTLTIDFGSFDLTPYNTDTISIYSSTDGINWTKENTNVNLQTKTASAQLSHFTHFALMAERRDTTPPTTTAGLDGTEGQPDWFRSDVTVSLNAGDNDGGLGIDYTLYKLDGSDWETYTSALTVTTEGHHKIEFYSADKDENIEAVKSKEFDIDKTVPEAKLYTDSSYESLVVKGIDNNQTDVQTTDQSSNLQPATLYSVSDSAGNKISLLVYIKPDHLTRFSIQSIKYNDDHNTIPPVNVFGWEKTTKDVYYKLEQGFNYDNNLKIRIAYNSFKDQSDIYKQENGTLNLIETRPGLVLLQLTTEKGTLKYSY